MTVFAATGGIRRSSAGYAPGAAGKLPGVIPEARRSGGEPLMVIMESVREVRRYAGTATAPATHVPADQQDQQDQQEVVHAERDHDPGLDHRAPTTAARLMMPQTRRVPAGLPPGTLPPGTLPPGTLPPGTLPPETFPSKPPEPSETLPPGTPPPSAHARETPSAPANPQPVRVPRIATQITYLAVLVMVASGVYISWHQGSGGGGLGGVIAGGAFIIAAVARFALPRKLSGLLASRSRVADVVTFVIFGSCLLVLGLVLPR